ncbi:MAG: nuclear transport factor 2 family protein [Pseudomonadota bacterium]
MHPTISRIEEAILSGKDDDIKGVLAEDVAFRPPTYFKTWRGRDAVAAVLGHVAHVFSDFRYRRKLGEDRDWALEFECKVGAFDAVGVDLLKLGANGLITEFEVVMRPYKTVGALREAMNERVMRDPRFLKFKDALE